MKDQYNQNDGAVNFSLASFLETGSFYRLFDAIKTSLQKEQRELVLGRKTRQETDSYFNFMKFLFSSPDRVA